MPHPQITKQQVYDRIIEESRKSFDFFLDALAVKSGKGRADFGQIMAVHQRKCFNKLVPSIEAVRNGTEPPIKRFWLERTKKASKDTDIAACLLWLLCFPTRPLLIQIGAADKDQAAIARDRLNDFLFYNPWLRDLCSIKKYDAESADGLTQLSIEAADIAGSHGATPDVLVCNEVSHITKWEFLLNLLDNVDGVPHSVAILATNAGIRNSDAWVLREACRKNPNWYKHIFSQPAPWHNEQFLEDARQREKTITRYNRLWRGIWSSGTGDAFSDELIDAMFVPGLKEQKERDPKLRYVLGLDLGVSKDHAGVAVLGVDTERQKIITAFLKGFEPDPITGEVDLVLVTQYVEMLHRRFLCQWVGYDPYQAKLMAQILTGKGVPMKEVSFTGKNLDIMAMSLKDVLEARCLEAYDIDDHRLRTDIGKFRIVEKLYGFRLEATSDATGHADVGTALVIALPKAVSLLGSLSLRGDEEVAWSDEKEMTREERENLPEEFRQMFDDLDSLR